MTRLIKCYNRCALKQVSKYFFEEPVKQAFELDINFLVDLVTRFLKLYVDCTRKCSVTMKIEPSEIGF
jgi:hypothetical protein